MTMSTEASIDNQAKGNQRLAILLAMAMYIFDV